MTRSAFLALLGALLISAPAGAAGAPPAWSVDKGQSRLGFRGMVEGLSFDGVFRRWDAAIAFDPNNLAASKVRVVIDTASAFTNSPDRDQSLPTEEWFATKRFPQAVFSASRFTALGGSRYQAAGDLTIKGVKRPVTLPFTLAIAGNEAKMTGSLVLDRTAFGVGSGRWKSDETVATKVTVSVNLTARRAR